MAHTFFSNGILYSTTQGKKLGLTVPGMEFPNTGQIMNVKKLENFTGLFCVDLVEYSSMPQGTAQTLVTLNNGNYWEVINNGGTIATRLMRQGGTQLISLMGTSSLSGYTHWYTGMAFGYMDATTPAFITFRETYGSGGWNGSFYNLINIVSDTQTLNAYKTFINGEYIENAFDPYVTDENHTPTGGFGPYDYTSETDTPPQLPALSAAQAGFVTLWNPTLGEVQSLSSYLWSSSLFDIATWQKLWNDPMETILALGMIPVEPTKGARRNIHFGSSDTGIESTPITEQFVRVDFGSMRINGQSASYMDYSPYAKANLFLPYCGTYALDIDDIMDATIALEYHIDIYTGACVAYLTIQRTNSDGSAVNASLYQFSGNVLTSIPVTASDHSQFLQSMLFMGASLAATVATAGAAAPAVAEAASAGALGGAGAAAGTSIAGGMTAGSAINTVMSMKPNVQRSGNMSSNAGMLGKQTPSITITWSNLCRPEDEYKLAGMPLHKSGALGDFEGFTVVSDVHLANVLCTEEEREMIRAALAEGVIV